MLKKSLSVLLSFTFLLSMFVLLPVSAGAITTGDYQFDVLSDMTAKITKYKGNASVLSIPTHLNGIKVTCIGYAAFSECNSLTNITIPDSVTSIDKYAFSNCSSLTNVDFGKSVTHIGDSAFSGCEALEELTIPDSVASIGGFAFENTAWFDVQPNGLVYAGKIAYHMKGECPAEVAIRPGTKGIAGCAFIRCTPLTGITIPESVKRIENMAFYGCTSLKNVTIPYTVKSIDNMAFGYYYHDDIEQIGGFIIKGYTDSEAERYAKDNHFRFESLGAVPAVVPGDADGDGDVTSVDVALIQRHCAQLPTNTDEDVLMNADVDGNGVLEIVDATFIQRHLADMTVPYPIG